MVRAQVLEQAPQSAKPRAERESEVIAIPWWGVALFAWVVGVFVAFKGDDSTGPMSGLGGMIYSVMWTAFILGGCVIYLLVRR